MQYRRLGDAGVQLSEIGLGGWLTYSNAIDEAQTRAVLMRALELGINFLDSADAYNRGGCEELWGRILKDAPARGSYVLSTKVFFPMGDGPNDRGLSRKHIMESCHASLKRLATDYIDIYFCHRFDENTPLEETVRAMDDLITQGKVLYWGFSEWSVEQIEQCLKICADRYYRPKASQPRYNVLDRKIESGVMPLCDKAGIGQVVWSPLAQGVLTGKYKPNAAVPKDSRAADKRQNHFIDPLVKDQALLEKVQKFSAISADAGCSMAQMALAWILRRKEITSCIIGATRPAQLEDNVEASGVQLDDDIVRRMEEVVGN